MLPWLTQIMLYTMTKEKLILAQERPISIIFLPPLQENGLRDEEASITIKHNEVIRILMLRQILIHLMPIKKTLLRILLMCRLGKVKILNIINLPIGNQVIQNQFSQTSF